MASISRILVVLAASLAFAAPSFAKSVSRARLISWPNPSKLGQPAVLLAEIDGLGGGAPKGVVTFTEGDTVLGSRPINPYGAGQATLASGGYHTCSLTIAGGVACWGDNSQGQLGDGTTTHRHAPVSVSGLTSDVIAVTAGVVHTCALTRAGAVKCWGENISGKLGDGTEVTRSAPVDVVGLRAGVVAIAAGFYHTCALTKDGAVKCWGRNLSGALGAGSSPFALKPVAVSHLSSGIVAITAGVWHSCALTKGGAVTCWGANFRGQLGDGTTTDRYAPVHVPGLNRGVVALAAGWGHTCALISGGAVECWGANYNGELGNGTTTHSLTPVAVSGLSNGVVAIKASYEYTCALTSGGAVKCWGGNGDIAFGDGGLGWRDTPVAVSGLSSGVVAIATGDIHSCALTGAGVIECWGVNNYGQLGDGTTTDRLIPTTIAGFTALVRSRTWISTRTLGVGAHALRASYPGDSSHGGSSIRYGHAVE